MVREVYLLIALVVVAGAFLIRRFRIGFHQVRKYWGKMLVTCPETHETAAVDVGKGEAAMSAMLGHPHVELSSCTRWPEKEDCGQECLSQIEQDSESHRWWTVASRWFVGKKCVYCGQVIGVPHHFDHQGALRTADRTTTEWNQVPPEKLPEVLSHSDPVCWNCHVVETFRRLRPQLVVERPRGG